MIKTFKDVLNYIHKHKLTVSAHAAYEGARVLTINNTKVTLPISDEELGKIINKKEGK